MPALSLTFEATDFDTAEPYVSVLGGVECEEMFGITGGNPYWFYSPYSYSGTYDLYLQVIAEESGVGGFYIS